MLSGRTIVNYVNFNQTGSCISVGTSSGVKVFSCDPFGKFYSDESETLGKNGYGIVEMLFSTSLLAVVGLGEDISLSPRRLRLLNTKRDTVICEITFPTSILSIKMNKSRLVILLTSQIYIYDITNMRLLHTIETSSPNLAGLIAVSPNLENNYLLYSSPPKVINSEIKDNATTNNITLSSEENVVSNSTSQVSKKTITSTNINITEDSAGKKNGNDASVKDLSNNPSIKKNGDIIIFDLKNLQPIMVIEAHKGEIAALTISQDGKYFATASEKGTIIRVFSVENGNKIYQFRRGTYPTRIHSLNFSVDNTFLNATSSSRTVHIFKLVSSTPSIDTNKNTSVLSSSSSGNTAISSSSEGEAIDDEISGNASVYRTLNLPAHEEEEEEDDDDDDEEEEEEEENADDDDGQRGTHVGNHHFNTEENTNQTNTEPIVDSSRSTVARMIRKSSQKLSRKAVKTLGAYFPTIKVSSFIEPSRHFASFKIPIVAVNAKEDDNENGNNNNGNNHNVTRGSTSSTANQTNSMTVPSDVNNLRFVAAFGTEYLDINISEYPELLQEYMKNDLDTATATGLETNENSQIIKMLPIHVISTEGFLYTYFLDPARGGDCLLINQYSLLQY
ncbi:related to Autophagy-related protein 18 [Saccharomycodes ludwigii]|uniref:Related to Autophagy-related protein 18 n=1 Tax=Saccharomycodes ludwigii TaxID=36035 RepID=A0A376B0U8_9ASCO|nr:related to Autophagy-related protein 18 [Saccharomycodes ludwigii]